jgi:putative membrane protein
MSYFNSNSVFGWDWFLWMIFIFIMFSSFGNWGYSYSAHRRLNRFSSKDAAAILNERYARGELTRVQYLELKSDIAAA